MAGRPDENVRSPGARRRPLGEVTAELTTLLGNPDPGVRLGRAVDTLTSWLRQGVYDDLLVGLGDGMASGLQVGLGESGTDTVLRRAASATVLAEVIARDNTRSLVTSATVLQWGDRLATWLLRERDLCATVAGRGRADPIACGADALAALIDSPHLQHPEIAVILDVLAERVVTETDQQLSTTAADRLAAACLTGLRHDPMPQESLESWVQRIARAAVDAPASTSAGIRAFLGSLFVRLSLTTTAPSTRADLLLTVVTAIRESTDDL